MRKTLIRTLIALAALAAALPAVAQSGAMPFSPQLQKELAARASSYSEVTLDRKMLSFASQFMNGSNDAEGKRIVAKLKGVYVRSYEFDKPGQYTTAEVASIRRHFEGGDWSPIVKQRSRGATDDADIYMKMVNGQVEGMFILNAEPKELDFVYIDGPIRPEDLSDLSGNFGIPNVGGGHKGKEARK
jgi:hypothetical protein